MGNWEYKKVYYINLAFLNKLGGQGWELCAATSENLFLFKRPMLCINCQNYKEELTHIRYDSKFYDKKCLIGNKKFVNKCGCEEFEPKN